MLLDLSVLSSRKQVTEEVDEDLNIDQGSRKHQKLILRKRKELINDDKAL